MIRYVAAVSCSLLLLSGYANAGDIVARPSKIRRFFSHVYLGSLTRAINRTCKKIGTWEQNGRVDFHTTGKESNHALSKVRNAVKRVGERLNKAGALGAFQVASAANQKHFKSSIQQLRQKIVKLDGIHFAGRTMTELIVGNIEKRRGGIAGVSHFLETAKLGGISAIPVELGVVRMVDSFGVWPSYLTMKYRLNVIDHAPNQ